MADAFCVSVSNFEGVNIPNMLIAREDLAAEIGNIKKNIYCRRNI